jgi:hypothetical protein
VGRTYGSGTRKTFPSSGSGLVVVENVGKRCRDGCASCSVRRWVYKRSVAHSSQVVCSGFPILFLKSNPPFLLELQGHPSAPRYRAAENRRPPTFEDPQRRTGLLKSAHETRALVTNRPAGKCTIFLSSKALGALEHTILYTRRQAGGAYQGVCQQRGVP